MIDTQFVDYAPMPYLTSASADASVPQSYYMTSAPTALNSANLAKFRAFSNRFSHVSAEEIEADIEAAFREATTTHHSG